MSNQSKDFLKEKIQLIIDRSNELPNNIIYKDNFDLQKLEEEADKELSIEVSELTKKQSIAPVIYHRYFRIMQDFLRKVRYYTKLYNQLYKAKYEWYKNYHDFLIDKKTEAEIYVKGDDDILNIKEKLDDASQIVTYLTSICERFSRRSFEIKNIIDWEKFKNGD